MVCAAGSMPGELAQALAHTPAGRLPHGVRLFPHGLRNRRGLGVKNGIPGT